MDGLKPPIRINLETHLKSGAFVRGALDPKRFRARPFVQVHDYSKSEIPVLFGMRPTQVIR